MLTIVFLRTALLVSAIICTVVGIKRKQKLEEFHHLFSDENVNWLHRVMKIDGQAMNKKYGRYNNRNSYQNSSRDSKSFNQDEEDFLMGHGVYTGINIAESQFQESNNADSLNFADNHHHF